MAFDKRWFWKDDFPEFLVSMFGKMEEEKRPDALKMYFADDKPFAFRSFCADGTEMTTGYSFTDAGSLWLKQALMSCFYIPENGYAVGPDDIFVARTGCDVVVRGDDTETTEDIYHNGRFAYSIRYEYNDRGHVDRYELADCVMLRPPVSSMS